MLIFIILYIKSKNEKPDLYHFYYTLTFESSNVFNYLIIKSITAFKSEFVRCNKVIKVWLVIIYKKIKKGVGIDYIYKK